jgi:hypothetical protein
MYVGVTWDGRAGKWEARVVCDNKRVYVGRFDSEEQAAIQRDLRALKLLQEVR